MLIGGPQPRLPGLWPATAETPPIFFEDSVLLDGCVVLDTGPVHLKLVGRDAHRC
jgi:hypothetical protein